MKKNTLVEIICVWFIILFLYTAISKLLEYSVFKEQISISPFLAPAAWFISWFIPVSEIAVAILLFVPKWRKLGLYGCLSLMIGFTIYVAALLALDDHLPCSCGGVIELLSWRGHLLFNGCCCALALVAILMNNSSRSNSILALSRL